MRNKHLIQTAAAAAVAIAIADVVFTGQIDLHKIQIKRQNQ